MMGSMNENAARILNYIDTYVYVHQYGPSMREIADDLGLALATVHYHINVLVENDQLTKAKGLPRTLRPV